MVMQVYRKPSGELVAADPAEAKAFGWTPQVAVQQKGVVTGTTFVPAPPPPQKPLEQIITEKKLSGVLQVAGAEPKVFKFKEEPKQAIVAEVEGKKVTLPISKGVAEKITKAGGLEEVYRQQQAIRMRREQQMMLTPSVAEVPVSGVLTAGPPTKLEEWESKFTQYLGQGQWKTVLKHRKTGEIKTVYTWKAPLKGGPLLQPWLTGLEVRPDIAGKPWYEQIAKTFVSGPIAATTAVITLPVAFAQWMRETAAVGPEYIPYSVVEYGKGIVSMAVTEPFAFAGSVAGGIFGMKLLTGTVSDIAKTYDISLFKWTEPKWKSFVISEEQAFTDIKTAVTTTTGEAITKAIGKQQLQLLGKINLPVTRTVYQYGFPTFTSVGKVGEVARGAVFVPEIDILKTTYFGRFQRYDYIAPTSVAKTVSFTRIYVPDTAQITSEGFLGTGSITYAVAAEKDIWEAFGIARTATLTGPDITFDVSGVQSLVMPVGEPVQLIEGEEFKVRGYPYELVKSKYKFTGDVFSIKGEPTGKVAGISDVTSLQPVLAVGGGGRGVIFTTPKLPPSFMGLGVSEFEDVGSMVKGVTAERFKALKESALTGLFAEPTEITRAKQKYYVDVDYTTYPPDVSNIVTQTQASLQRQQQRLQQQSQLQLQQQLQTQQQLQQQSKLQQQLKAKTQLGLQVQTGLQTQQQLQQQMKLAMKLGLKQQLQQQLQTQQQVQLQVQPRPKPPTPDIPIIITKPKRVGEKIRFKKPRMVKFYPFGRKKKRLRVVPRAGLMSLGREMGESIRRGKWKAPRALPKTKKIRKRFAKQLFSIGVGMEFPTAKMLTRGEKIKFTTGSPESALKSVMPTFKKRKRRR